MHRLLATQHGNRFESGQAFAPRITGVAELAAPQSVVSAKTQAIQRNADHRGAVECHAVLRQAGGDMGVVVLHVLQRE